MADNKYISEFLSGKVIDAILRRAMEGGALDKLIAEKAPGGKGYGDVAGTYNVTNATELPTILSSIYSEMSNKTKRTVILYFTYSDPKTISGGQWFVEIHRNDASYGFARASQYDIDTVNEMTCAFWNGTWKDFAWVNPKMALGVEYRTTERHYNKPVYTQFVTCGALPVNAIAPAYVKDPNGNQYSSSISIFDVSAFASTDSYGNAGYMLSIPFVNNSALSPDITATVSGTTVYFRTSAEDFTTPQYYGFARVKYIKP